MLIPNPTPIEVGIEAPMNSMFGGPLHPRTAIEAATPEANVIVLNLTVAEQRKVVEHMAQGACFRMRISEHEYKVMFGKVPAWQFCTLSDGSHAMWQPYSQLTPLRRGPKANAALYNDIRSKMIGDEVV